MINNLNRPTSKHAVGQDSVLCLSLCQVLASNSWIQRGWTNNNAESYNHVLKTKTSWKQKNTVNALISAVADLVQLQTKDLQRALRGDGNFLLSKVK